MHDLSSQWVRHGPHGHRSGNGSGHLGSEVPAEFRLCPPSSARTESQSQKEKFLR